MTQEPGIIPLRERKKDLFFIVVFAVFACTSFLGDAMHALGLVDAKSGGSLAWYIEASQDQFFAAEHAFTRFSTGVSAFVYGPFYLLLVYAFVAGRNFIRPLALVYVGAIVYGTAQFIWWEYTIGPAPGGTLVFWIFNGTYILVPVMLAFRLWKAEPFTRNASSG